MLRTQHLPVRSEYRYTNNMLPYKLQEHITSASQQNQKQSFTLNTNRPHLNVILDGKHKVKALIDSGSTVCMGDSSIIKHLKPQTPDLPIFVTDVHKNRKPTLGCYLATLSVEDTIPYPVVDKPIKIHMQNNLSSELIIGTDFLRENGAIIDVRTNNAIFFPDKFFAVSLSKKPIVCEAFASVVNDVNGENKDISKYNMATFAVQPTEDVTIPHMDQKTIHVQLISDNHRMIHKPDTTIMLTSGMAPNPQILDGLYKIEHDHTIRVTIKNSSTGNLFIQQNRPIPGIVAHDLEMGYHEPVEITKETLRALFLKDQTVKAAKLAGILPEDKEEKTMLTKDHPEYTQPTPEQYISSVQTQFEEACSLLQASGLEPPGNKARPKQKATLEVRNNLRAQFNTAGIEEEYIQDYIQLIMDNWDVFSLHKYDVGHTPHWEHKIESTTNEPVYVKQFKIAIGDEAALDEMSTHLTAAKILIQQPSDNNTPIFMVAKRGGPHPGKKRFVQDFRRRNAASKDDKYTIKDVRESLVAVGRLKPKIWSKLDFTGAFYCLSLEKESQKLTSFTLPFKSSQYSWARMPQGLKGASASFSKLCQIIFRHIPNIITYVDDLIGATTTHMDMIKLLNEVFAECRHHGMKLNLQKCQFGLLTLSWLGYNLSSNGISPDEDKAEAVKTMVLPTTIKEIQSHLGLFQFFAHLIDKYALIAGPLTAVTSTEHPWRSYKLSGDLPKEARDSWYKLRDIIAAKPVIAFPDFSLPFQIFVDSSVGKPHGDPPIRGGAGAILTQVQNGVTRAIGYFSRQFRDSESRYNAFNAELCGLVAALDHFMTYIKNSQVTAFTDHMPLVKAASKERATEEALLHKLSAMDLTLIHITGADMPADALSRLAREAVRGNLAVSSATIMEALPEAMSDLHWKFEQSECPQCKVMKAWLKEQKISPSHMMQIIIKLFASSSFIDSDNGLLYIYSGKTKRLPNKRLWVPQRLRTMIMTNHHGSTLGGHWREEKTYEAIAIKYFWPSMATDIESHVKMCKICHQQNDRHNSKNKVPLHPWDPPKARNERIHFDLVGPLKSSDTGFKHILSITDAFSRWVELVPIINKEAITVAKALWDHWICRFGFFKQSVSDGGGEFANDVLKELTKLMSSKHHIISPYMPSVNGVIERVHQSIGAYVKSFCDEQTTDWVSFLPALTFSINTRIHSGTKFSPYFITYGEHPTFPWTPTDNITYSESEIVDRVRLLQYAQQLCLKNDLEARASSKRAFDVKAKFRQFKIHDQVLLYLPSPPKGHNKKFYTPWKGIYHVIEKTSPLTYIVKKKGGRKRRAHVNRLKFYNPMDSQEDPLVDISIEDDEQDTEDNIQDRNDNHHQNPHNQPPKKDPNNITNYTGRITRSKTNSLPQQSPRFQSSSIYQSINTIPNHQYPWAHTHLKNSLKQVNIDVENFRI